MALYCASPFLIQPVSADLDFAIFLSFPIDGDDNRGLSA